MAMAMHQDKATASSEVEVSETAARRRWKSELEKQEKSEATLIAYLNILADEELERRREQEPNKRLEWPRSVVVIGRYAIVLLAELPLELTQPRMRLCAWVVNAWIYCRWDEAEEFAEALRRWPTVEDKEVSKVLRERTDESHNFLVSKIGQFFRWAEVPTGPNEIYRTMFKAMARQMTMEEIVCLGAGIAILNHESYRSAFRDFIRNANKR